MFGEEYLYYEAPCYIIFSIPLLPPLSEVQTFSLAPCSQTLWIYVLALVWKTKFYTHTEQEIKLQFCIFNLCVFREETGRQKVWTEW
jgi:hypothetical protein